MAFPESPTSKNQSNHRTGSLRSLLSPEAVDLLSGSGMPFWNLTLGRCWGAHWSFNLHSAICRLQMSTGKMVSPYDPCETPLE